MMDEGQLEVSKGFVKWKKFDTKDEAKAFVCPEGKIWSDVIEVGEKFYRAYSRVGEIAAQAVNLSGKHFKLNVELTSGYIVGKSWADCH